MSHTPVSASDQAVEEFRTLPGDRLGLAQNDVHSGRDDAFLWCTAVPGHSGLDVAIERLHIRLRVLQREDHLRPARGKVPATFRGACLHDHRAPLRAARRRQRSARPDPLALIIGIADLRWIRVDAALAIIDDGIGIPRIPQRVAGFHDLIGMIVARAPSHKLVHAEVLRLTRIR